MKLNAQIKNSVQNTGVICFSSSKNNILLWSHYANGHTGFAVGFDTQKLTKAVGELKLESFIKEIFYTDTYPEAEILRCIKEPKTYSISFERLA